MKIEFEYPAFFDHILGNVAEVVGDRQFTIGGGAVRDVVLAREIKDIDLFVSCDSYVDAVNIINVIRHKFGFDPIELIDEVKVTEDNPYPGMEDYEKWFQDRGVGKVNLMEKEGWPYPVQVVAYNKRFFHSEEGLCKKFDFGLSKATYSLGGKTYFHLDFWKDINDRVFRVRSNYNIFDDDYDRNFKRWKRVRDRYPEFGFEIQVCQ